jgi:hypothetical protein
MPTDPWASFLAWWGAGLSTLLAVVKLWELWRDRVRVDVSYNFREGMERGNDILIRNLSPDPLILEHWELVYSSGRWPRRRFEPLLLPDPDAGDIRIEEHTSHTLHFAEQNYFAWGHRALKGRAIAIRLHFAGRRSILRSVYSP